MSYNEVTLHFTPFLFDIFPLLHKTKKLEIFEKKSPPFIEKRGKISFYKAQSKILNASRPA